MADVSVNIEKNKINDAETYLGVEYIESTGTQYINLGVDIDYNTTDLFIDYQYTDVTGTSTYSQGGVYSISYNRVYNDALWTAFTSSGYGLYAYYYGRMVTERLSENATTSRVILERNSNGLYFNGTKQDVSSPYVPIGNKTGNITLFAMNYGYSNDILMFSKMKLHAFKLGNNKGYKYDLVPCIRKSDNVAGMYDKISKKFYTNEGFGEFVVGQFTNEVYFNNIFTIDKNNGLKSVESLSESTGQPKDIFYGIIANTGSINVIDYDGKVANKILSGELPNSNIKMDIMVNGKQVQSHISTNSTYNSNTRTFVANLGNDLSKWNDVKFAGLGIQTTQMSLYELLKYVFKSTIGLEDIDYMLQTTIVYGDSNIEGSVKSYLEKIFIPFPYLKEGTLYSTIEKICVIGQLNVLEDDSGFIKFVSSRPQKTTSDTIMVIPRKMQESEPIKDLILNNKYMNANVESYHVNVKTNKNTSVSSQIDTIEIYRSDKETATVNENKTINSQKLVARVQSFYKTGSFSFIVGESLVGQTSYIQQVNALENSNSFEINISSVPNMYDNVEGGAENKYINITTQYELSSYDDTQSGGKVGYWDLIVPLYDEIADKWNEYDPSDIDLTISGKSGNFGGSISAKYEVSSAYYAKTSEEDESYFNVTRNGNVVNVEYKILTGKDEIAARITNVDAIGYDGVELYRDIKQYRAKTITINLLGTLITFDFASNNETQASTNDNTFNLNTNELMQDVAFYKNPYSNSKYNLPQLIKENLIKDYSNGVATCSFETNCINVYDVNGKLNYTFKNGDILKVGDIVRVDKDNNGKSLYLESDDTAMLFRVVGRTFKKQGVPLIDLKLQQITQQGALAGLYFDDVYNEMIMTWLYLVDNGMVVLSDDRSILLSVDKNIHGYLKIPSTIKTISAEAFSGCNSIYGIIVPDSVTSIGSAAFSECLGLKSISLGKGITKIDTHLFYGCTSLQRMTIPENIINIEPYSFANCTGLLTISLNEGLKTIGASAFNNCDITSVTIPSTVNQIGREAFVGCLRLSSATFKTRSGWRASDGSTYHGVTLTNHSTNAIYLKETYTGDWVNDEV